MADLGEDGQTTYGVPIEIGSLKSGYTPFANEDLLVAKITPCFENGKIGQVRIPTTLGWGSTEFHVIRPNDETVDRRFLLHFLRSPAVRANGEMRMTGSAGQRRVPVDYLKSLGIPLPPLPEQRRIAAILDETNALRAAHKRELDSIDTLVESTFTSIFGLSGTGPRIALKSLVASSQLGLVRGAKELGVDRETPYLRMDAIEPSGQLRLTDWSLADTSAGEREKYSLRAGDFLFNTRNSRQWVGKAAVVPEDVRGVFNNNILRIRFADADLSEYLSCLWRRPAIRRQLDQMKSGTTSVFAIYARDLMEVQVPLPAKAALQDFKGAAIAIRRARNRSESRRLDTLFASLQHRAFRGEL